MKFTLVGISQPKEILLQSSDRMLELQLHSGLLQEALESVEARIATSH